jgi:hypothetical protein
MNNSPTSKASVPADNAAITRAYNIVTNEYFSPESVLAALKSMARVIRKNATTAQREVDAKIAEREDPLGPDSPNKVREKIAAQIREAGRSNR